MAAGEVELPEFFQIMTMTREAEAEATFWGDEFGGDESISESPQVYDTGRDKTIQKTPRAATGNSPWRCLALQATTD